MESLSYGPATIDYRACKDVDILKLTSFSYLSKHKINPPKTGHVLENKKKRMQEHQLLVSSQGI